MKPIKIHFIDTKTLIKDATRVVFTDALEGEMTKDALGNQTLVIGRGKAKSLNRRKVILLLRKIVCFARYKKIKKLIIHFADLHVKNVTKSPEEIAELAGINFEMANFQFVTYKTPPKEGWNFVEEIYITGIKNTSIKKAFSKGQLIGEEVNKTRTLSNTPGGEMTPAILAQRAREAIRGTKARIKVLGKTELQKMKMGGVLGVAQGSDAEPKFIIMEYFGGKKSEKPIVLVGKGVTFDTGGLNLKPSNSIYEMHMDMSGGAAVIHTLALAARLGLKRNIIGLVPAVENMPSGTSYRPGDVLRSLSGKTIEVLNTDAEGRIILADGLTYALKYKPLLVVDVATLTGAASVALGERATALFTSDQKLEKLFRVLGEESGDFVWPLPLWEEYESEIRGTFGDWANVGKTRYGDAILAAVFLWQFIKDQPWVHLDIASRMTTIDGEYLSKGAAGAPVRLLIKLLEHYGKHI